VTATDLELTPVALLTGAEAGESKDVVGRGHELFRFWPRYSISTESLAFLPLATSSSSPRRRFEPAEAESAFSLKALNLPPTGPPPPPRDLVDGSMPFSIIFIVT
jgi:hypothetical protein